jgi:hypothetical protein
MRRPTVTHDPLCPEYGNTGWIHGVGDCQCDLIARVRIDEHQATEAGQVFAHCEHCPEGCDDEHGVPCEFIKGDVCVIGSRRLS